MAAIAAPRLARADLAPRSSSRSMRRQSAWGPKGGR